MPNLTLKKKQWVRLREIHKKNPPRRRGEAGNLDIVADTKFSDQGVVGFTIGTFQITHQTTTLTD